MKRLHVMLKVRDLDGSIDFYRTLFGGEPTVRRPDYAKWMLDDPRVNFSLGQVPTEACDCGDACGCGEPVPGIEHLGIQAESREELAELRERVGRIAESAGGADVDDEGETTCCYARSDKTWVTDGQGVSWEMFYTHGASDTYAGAATDERPACCA